jgi:hypothetical protein
MIWYSAFLFVPQDREKISMLGQNHATVLRSAMVKVREDEPEYVGKMELDLENVFLA